MQEYFFVDQIPVFIVEILCKYVFTFVVDLICLSKIGPRLIFSFSKYLDIQNLFENYPPTSY